MPVRKVSSGRANGVNAAGARRGKGEGRGRGSAAQRKKGRSMNAATLVWATGAEGGNTKNSEGVN